MARENIAESRADENQAAVRRSIEALYSTRITDTNVAELRGAAVRAVDAFGAAIGVPGLAAEFDGRS